MGLFYVDGHVRAYHGGQPVAKHHVARMRIAMPAEEDVWLNDAGGDGLLVWQAPPGASLAGELRQATTHIRDLVGPEARPTVCFDRGGCSPKLFAELSAAGFDILVYRKGHTKAEPTSAFATHTHVDAAGRTHRYELADRPVRISYDGGRRRFVARQITRRSPNGHQTHIITTRRDRGPRNVLALAASSTCASTPSGRRAAPARSPAYPPISPPPNPSTPPSKTTELCNHSRTCVRSPGVEK
jgi:hypothetical protein